MTTDNLSENLPRFAGRYRGRTLENGGLEVSVSSCTVVEKIWMISICLPIAITRSPLLHPQFDIDWSLNCLLATVAQDPVWTQKTVWNKHRLTLSCEDESCFCAFTSPAYGALGRNLFSGTVSDEL